MGTEDNKGLDRDRLEILLKLADVSWRDMDTRRPTEWRANLALWGGLAIFSGLVLKGEATVPGLLKFVVAAILTGIVVVYTFWWTRWQYRRNWQDLRIANYFWDRVEDGLGVHSPRPRSSDGPEPTHFLWNWSRGSQVLITWLFLLAAIASVFGR
jgi:hypothetical protein